MKLPKVEVLMIFIFFGCVAVWAVSRCNDQRSRTLARDRSVTDEEDRPVRRDTVYMTPKSGPAPQQTVQQQPVQLQPVQQQPVQPPPTTPVNTKSPEKQPRPELGAGNGTANTGGSLLYCNVEGLNVRSEPNVRSKTVATLKKHEAVTFLNQKTDFTEELNLGDGKVTDHWVKIKTKSGKTGWVFGAGVHYYKK